MEIKLAQTAGFCWGVKRALDITLDAAKSSSGKIFTYGPLIHNPQVIERLRGKGVEEKAELDTGDGETMVIRTHGITPEKRKEIKEQGYKIKDATCPLVMKVQSTIKRHTKKGYVTVIVGDRNHAEVIGLMGFSEECYVVKSPDDVLAMPEDIGKMLVIGQTTLSTELFDNVVTALEKRYESVKVENTICEATESRQQEVVRLASEVDAMIVIGGKNSSNTKQLAIIATERGIPAFHIETEEELNPEELRHFERVGISAGASTPQWLIDNVIRKLEEIDRESEGVLTTFLRVASDSYLYLAFGSVFLYGAVSHLSGMAFSPLFAVTLFCFILGTYLLFNVLDSSSVKESDRQKETFYRRYRTTLVSVGGTSLIFAHILALWVGVLAFLSFLSLFVLSLFYFFPLLKNNMFGKYLSIDRLKDIPSSKDIGVSLFWGCAVVLIPSLTYGGGEVAPFFIAFSLVLVLSYIRTITFELNDLHVDGLKGRESMASVMGKEKSSSFVVYALLFFIACLLVGSFFGLTASSGWYFFLTIIYSGSYFWVFRKKAVKNRLLLNYIIDGQYYLPGLLALGGMFFSVA